ncbi:MAG: GYD domain-containing protein [Gemmatimonadetes bacterium]|nr:GYD domain-containing protein [Gemmatimonadota bacterium]MBT8478671.1 GYD domain-containing protein [Gemmatimonadota bacterium]NNK48495.1 GYD domain-containing protein [Gemmatimonadota bacterium]
MAKYLVAGSYTPDGIPGLMEDGGTGRVEKVTRMVESLGGKIEAFYYGFGDHDVYLIVDLPDHESATAISMAVNASGTVVLSTTVLLTPEQMDAAARKAVDYRAPGD